MKSKDSRTCHRGVCISQFIYMILSYTCFKSKKCIVNFSKWWLVRDFEYLVKLDFWICPAWKIHPIDDCVNILKMF